MGKIFSDQKVRHLRLTFRLFILMVLGKDDVETGYFHNI